MTATARLRTPFDDRTFRLAGDEDDGSVMGALRHGDGLYEPDLMVVLSRLVGPDWVCLDVGANIGAIAVVLAHLCPAGRVHAFEAAPENHAHLVANLDANGASNAVAHHAALYDRDGTLTLHFTSSFAAGSFVSDAVDEGVAHEVPARRLDSWVAEEGLDRVDLVKLDVEGAEARVLDGATATIERHRPHLVVEFNPIVTRRFGGRAPGDLWEALAARYPRRYAIGPGGTLTPVVAWPQLRALLHERAVVDLFCTFAAAGRAGRALDLPARGAVARARAAAALAAAGRPRPRGPFLPEPRGEVVPGVDRLRLRPGEAATVQVWVTNTGDADLRSDHPHHPVHLGWRWRDTAGRIVGEGQRVGLGVLRPGESTRVTAVVEAPAAPGRYVAALAPIQDRVAWFDDLDPANGATIEVQVDAGDRA